MIMMMVTCSRLAFSRLPEGCSMRKTWMLAWPRRQWLATDDGFNGSFGSSSSEGDQFSIDHHAASSIGLAMV